MEIFPISYDYKRNDLKIKTFTPKENLFYLFFSENIKLTSNLIAKSPKKCFNIDYYKDIQRFRYYPVTKNIYTFLGFSNIQLRNLAMESPDIEERSIDHSTYIYPIKLPKTKRLENKNLQFEEFSPVEGLFYCFFAETSYPSKPIMSHKNLNRFGIKYLSDIQRFRYFPGSKKIYTFIGFSTMKQLNKGINEHSIKNNAVDHSIFLYAIQKVDLSNNEEEEEEEYYNEEEEKSFISLNLPKFNTSIPKNLPISEFSPEKNLFYCFFAEVTKPSISIIGKIDKNLFGIDYSSDIQRFCFYPKTKNIYTFMGFSNKKFLLKAMNNQSIKNCSIHHGIYIYPYTKDENENEQENAQENEEEEEEESESEIEIESNNLTKFPKFIKYNNDDLNFSIFKPKKKLFYLFLAEILLPTKNILSQKYVSLFGIKNASDIQRFCYYPNTKKIYTFIGFNDKKKLEIAMNADGVKCSSVEHTAFLFPLQNAKVELPPSNNYTKKDLNFKTFEPQKNLFYCFLAEKRQPTDEFINGTYYNIYGIKNCIDNQRFRFYPGSKNIYTFIGFETKTDRDKAMRKTPLRINSVGRKVYIYPFNADEDENKYENSNSSSDNDNNDDNDDDEVDFPVFNPRKDLIYLFFVEKDKPTIIKNNNKIETFGGINYFIDIQRFHYYPGMKKIYTFIGFGDQFLFDEAIESESLLATTLNNTIYTYPFQEEKTEDKEDKNDNSDSAVVSLELPKFQNYDNDDLNFSVFQPIKNIHYLFFAEKIKPTPNIIKKKYKALYSIDNAKDIQRFRFYPGTKNIYTYIGFKNGIIRYQVIKCSDLNKYAIDEKVFIYPYGESDEIEIEEMKDTSLSSLPNSTVYLNDDIKLKEFVPKKNLFYCFSAELSTPSSKLVNKTYNSLFSIQNAVDIQRFCYYPKTKKIFTFIGFSDETKRNNAMKYSAMASISIDKAVYIYPINNVDLSDEKFFDQKENLFYIKFMFLKESKKKGIRIENSVFLGVKNIKDLQQGFRISKDDPNYYTFFGFDKMSERDNALLVLNQKTDLIDIKTLHFVNEYEYDDSEIEDEDRKEDEEKEKEEDSSGDDKNKNDDDENKNKDDDLENYQDEEDNDYDENSIEDDDDDDDYFKDIKKFGVNDNRNDFDEDEDENDDV